MTTAILSWLRNGGTLEHTLMPGSVGPSSETLTVRPAALNSFYSWQDKVFDVPVARRLMRGTARRAPTRGLLAHLDARAAPKATSLVRVRRDRQCDRPLYTRSSEADRARAIEKTLITDE